MPKSKFDEMTDDEGIIDGETGIVPAPEEEEETTGTTLASFNQGPTQEFAPEDLEVPKIRLAQGQTPEVQDQQARAGQWLVFGSEPSDELTVIPLNWRKPRALYTPGDDGKLRCSSPDSVQGYGDPGIPCAGCPFSQWTPSDRADGKNNPPPCVERYEYLCWIPEAQSLGLLVLKKTGFRSGRIINSRAAQAGFGKFGVVLSSQAQQKGKSAYYVPVIRPVKVGPEDIAAASRFIG